jgi:hypothetical protein
MGLSQPPAKLLTTSAKAGNDRCENTFIKTVSDLPIHSHQPRALTMANW